MEEKCDSLKKFFRESETMAYLVCGLAAPWLSLSSWPVQTLSRHWAWNTVSKAHVLTAPETPAHPLTLFNTLCLFQFLGQTLLVHIGISAHNRWDLGFSLFVQSQAASVRWSLHTHQYCYYIYYCDLLRGVPLSACCEGVRGHQAQPRPQGFRAYSGQHGFGRGLRARGQAGGDENGSWREGSFRRSRGVMLLGSPETFVRTCL